MGKRLLLKNQGGIALVVSLLAISFLVAVTVQLLTSTDLQMNGAVTHSETVRMEAALFSGLSVARAALAADLESDLYDTLHDSWATIDTEKLAGAAGAGGLSVVVTDLSGRLPVNALVQPLNQSPGQRGREGANPRELEQKYRQVWQRFLTSGKFALEGEDEAAALIDAMVDWLDSEDDDQEEENGAENGYYQSLDPSYSCKNGKIEYIEELLLIKGMSRELLFGDEEHAGIIQYLTIGSEKSKINLNTAPMEVLLALHPEVTEEQVQDLFAYREDEANRELLKSKDWYKNVSGFGDVDLDGDLISTDSSRFEITVTATVGQHTRVGTGILVRDANDKSQTLEQWELE